MRVEGGGGNGKAVSGPESKAVSSHRTPSSEALPTGDDLRGLFKFGHRAALPASKPSIWGKKGGREGQKPQKSVAGPVPRAVTPWVGTVNPWGRAVSPWGTALPRGLAR